MQATVAILGTSTSDMGDFLNTQTAQVVIGLAGLLIVSVIGVYVVLRFRDSIEDTETSSDLLAKFREMKHQGYLNAEEFRTIRTDLESKLSPRASAESEVDMEKS
jgi:hypothetical protein